jgi:hypothetical protein
MTWRVTSSNGVPMIALTTPYPQSKTRLVRLMAQVVRFVAVIFWDRFFTCAVLAAVPVQPASPQALPVFVVSYRLNERPLQIGEKSDRNNSPSEEKALSEAVKAGNAGKVKNQTAVNCSLVSKLSEP